MAKATAGKKKPQTKALAKWDAKLAEIAQLAAQTEKNVGGGNVIGTQGGRLSYKGADIPENKMNVVIIDHILANLFYEGTFDPSSPTAPVCYAYGRGLEGEVMAPHEDSAKPQNETCEGCAQNEWGSADRGSGKACKNSRRIAVISERDLNNVAGAEIAFVHSPVTSVKAWAGYVRQIQQIFGEVPPFAVVTEISLVPDQQTQFRMLFKVVEQVDASLIGELIELHDRVKQEIEFPYVQITPAEKPAGRRAGRNTVPPQRGRQRAVVPARTAANSKFGKAAAPAKSRKFAR